jgi:hypothetical protein
VRETEPGLKPRGCGQHIAMTERNELWPPGRARRLQDEGGRARIGLSIDRSQVGDLRYDIKSKLTTSDRSGFDDGELSLPDSLACFNGTALRHQNTVQAQHIETPIDLCR